MEYLNNTNLSNRTKKEYASKHKTVERLFQKTLNEIISLSLEEIQNILKDLPTQKKYFLLSYILTFCKYNNITRKDLQSWLMDLKKEKSPVKEKKDFTFEDFNEKINAIEDAESKLILRLLNNYPVLRSDYNTIKIRNYLQDENYYSEGVIYFNKLVKVENKVSINLKDEDKTLIEKLITNLDRDFLFTYQNNSTFLKWIKKLSVKYLNVDYTLSDYRKLYPSKELSKCQSVKEFAEKQSEIAKNQNHSIPVQNTFYLQDKKFVSSITLEIEGKKILITGSDLSVKFI